jgi:hypothetical protein
MALADRRSRFNFVDPSAEDKSPPDKNVQRLRVMLVTLQSRFCKFCKLLLVSGSQPKTIRLSAGLSEPEGRQVLRPENQMTNALKQARRDSQFCS